MRDSFAVSLTVGDKIQRGAFRFSGTEALARERVARASILPDVFCVQEELIGLESSCDSYFHVQFCEAAAHDLDDFALRLHTDPPMSAFGHCGPSPTSARPDPPQRSDQSSCLLWHLAVHATPARDVLIGIGSNPHRPSTAEKSA